LVADIKGHGLLEPIWLYQGKILDGRNRYRACNKAGIKPRFSDYKGADPPAFIISRNLKRRYLNASQRAMAADSLAVLKLGANQHALITDRSVQAAFTPMNTWNAEGTSWYNCFCFSPCNFICDKKGRTATELHSQKLKKNAAVAF
jgi:hypothetical protein